MNNIPVRKIRSEHPATPATGGFTIRTVLEITNGEELVHALHRHDFFFILVLKKGSGKHTIDFRTYTAAPNTLFLLRPGQVHELHLKPKTEGYLMEFNNEFYHPTEKMSVQRLRKLTTNNFYQLDRKGVEKLYPILSTMHHECREKQEGYLELIQSNLGIFFIELARQTTGSTLSSAGTTAYAQEKLEEFMILVEQNMASKKQVAFYTGLMNLSPYQLNGITNSLVGKSATQLINEHILLEAKRYLLATANQVKVIADQLGYEDVSYFIRFFKKHTGFTPDSFRQNFT